MGMLKSLQKVRRRICGKKKESNKEVEGEERKYLAEGTLWKAKWRERIINEDNNSEMLQS